MRSGSAVMAHQSNARCLPSSAGPSREDPLSAGSARMTSLTSSPPPQNLRTTAERAHCLLESMAPESAPSNATSAKLCVATKQSVCTLHRCMIKKVPKPPLSSACRLAWQVHAWLQSWGLLSGLTSLPLSLLMSSVLRAICAAVSSAVCFLSPAGRLVLGWASSASLRISRHTLDALREYGFMRTFQRGASTHDLRRSPQECSLQPDFTGASHIAMH